MFLCGFEIQQHENPLPFWSHFSTVPPPLRLLGGGGGNSAEEIANRSAILTAHALHPNWTSLRIRTELRRHLVNFNLSERTVRSVIASGAITVDTHGTEFVITPWHGRKIIKWLRGTDAPKPWLPRLHRHSTAQVQYLLGRCRRPIAVSQATIQRFCRRKNLHWRHRRTGPQLTEDNVAKRKLYYDWFTELRPQAQRSICYSDSVPLSGNHVFNTHNEGLWVHPSDPVPPVPRLRRPESTLHCYGCITRNGLLGPWFIQGSINQVTYQEQILTPMLDAIDEKFGDEPYIFMQDGAGPHRAKTTQTIIHSRDIDFIEAESWPGNSPDLNIIEGLWSELRSEAFPQGCYGISIPERKRRARQFFQKFTVERCRKYVESAITRMPMLKAVNFWSIAK